MSVTFTDSDAELRAAHQAVRRHARSFRWASRFLDSAQRDDAALLYFFCRQADDAVDEAPNAEVARARINALLAELDSPAPAAPVSGFLAVCQRRGFDPALGRELLSGCASDIGRVRFADDADLLRYAYRVAGTVGLMMLGILGIDDERAAPFAIDLGIAMQLTNICRDVIEDAGLGRVYLPADRLLRAGVDPEALASGLAPSQGVAAVVAEVLALAERYYESAERGRALSPVRSRWAVLVGARVYRAIGAVLRRQAYDPSSGRAVVSAAEKLLNTATASWRTLRPGVKTPPHDASLHTALRGLPGTSNSRQ